MMDTYQALRAGHFRQQAEIERLLTALHKIAEHPDTPELIRQYAVSQQEPK